MIQSHKSSTPAFRQGWDRTFKNARTKNNPKPKGYPQDSISQKEKEAT